MYGIQDDGKGRVTSVKALIDIGPTTICAYGSNRGSALAELRIILRAMQNELDYKLDLLKEAK